MTRDLKYTKEKWTELKEDRDKSTIMLEALPIADETSRPKNDMNMEDINSKSEKLDTSP